MKCLAWVFALALSGAAQAETTLKYTVLYFGNPAGAQTTVIGDDGRVRVTYSHRDNGRGPDLSEDIVVANDGTMRSYRLRGTSTFGAAIDERFSLERGRARWQSSSDRGERAVEGPAMYLPIEGSPEPQAMMVRAAEHQPDGRIASLPGGELRSVKLRDLRLHAGNAERAVALHALAGLGLRPVYLWLDADADMRLFARIRPGGAHVVAQGWEPQASELERLQQTAESDHLRGIAERSARHFPEPMLIRGVRVFDGASASLSALLDVYVYGGRIAAIYPAGSPAQAAATVIEGEGRALLPGLFDMHTHEDAWNSALQIAGGVTTSRDMGNDNAILADLIARIARGELLGPRIVAAGFIEGESPFSARADFVVNNVEEARAAIDWYAQRGYRQIKLYNSFRPEWVAPTAQYAHAHGLRVSGHVPAFTRAELVVRDGYDELQHINQVLLNFFVGPKDDTRTLTRFTLVGERTHLLDLDSQPVRDFIELLRSRQIVVDPTLATFEDMFTQRQGEMNPSFAAIADHLPFATQRAWRSNSMDVSDSKLATYRASYARMIGFIGRLHAAGVPLVAGTDNIAGFTLHRELELYVRAGMTPGEALRIATENGARYTGLLDEAGSIVPGKRADLILVDGDPTRDISDIRRISFVLKDGIGYAPADIYEALGVRRFSDPPRILLPAR